MLEGYLQLGFIKTSLFFFFQFIEKKQNIWSGLDLASGSLTILRIQTKKLARKNYALGL